MIKAFARTAGFLAYLLITFEMVFMVTPFALYYYSAYSPLLAWTSRFPATAWMPAFFLPHLSMEIVPSLGGVIFLLGLIGFLLGALQVYAAKFRRRGVVRTLLYRRLRHPQYLCLALAGLGLVIVWPRFILLIAYVNMLWLYYLLARAEERRMEARYGDAYRELMQQTWMFLPGEPGGRLARRWFGWIGPPRPRLLVLYACSLLAAVGGAFALRGSSLRLTPHLSLAERRIAAVSLVAGDGHLLRERLGEFQAALGARAEAAQRRPDGLDDWALVQVTAGKHQVTHALIDAGMTKRRAEGLPLAEKTVGWLFSRCDRGCGSNDPWSPYAHWQPVFIAETGGRQAPRVLELDRRWFPGNPVMPTF
jgi:protein-S-isoprenylcysteine O-methyltransferase Ste14